MSDTHAHSVAFVRTETIPQAAAPSNAAGPVKWARDNLFATPANAFLTVAALYVIYLILAATLPWIMNGVWNAAASLSVARFCRHVGRLLCGTDGTLAAVVVRVQYPSEEYWRPTLAFVLMFVALAPVLFFDLPRKLLIFTGLFPFLAYWLIWGGTILTPFLALLGFAAGYVVYSRFVTKSFAGGFFGGVAAAFVVWTIGGYIVPALAPEQPLLAAVPSRDLGGYMLNMMLGLTCVSLSVPLGIALALGRQSSMPLIKWICVIFIEFIPRCSVDYPAVCGKRHVVIPVPARAHCRLVRTCCDL